ncbi:MAG: hypothetical protein A3E87_00065 [Gammaproteobacteria bacterium RIFCSPHIGHO2_12_FULL_35_23]|nr:MAG: hypothetical protein A3E87_00065 [Gammaproteobacteria bacterium RIFCSPHIGHO2_12_FULL_35_23]
MKFKMKTLVIALGALSCLSVAYATDSSQAQLANELQSVSQEMQQLQTQVVALQDQVTVLRSKLKQQRTTSVPTNQISPESKRVVTTNNGSNNETSKSTQPLTPQELKIRQRLLSFGTDVVTGPFTSGPTYYNGSDLIVNSPSINEDVTLLRRRADSIIARRKVGLPSAPNPRLVLSGALEGIVQYSSSYQGKSTSDINLATSKLDIFAEITNWVNGYMSFAYDDSPPNTSANRIDNSRLFLDKGFITIGNLLSSPVYGSMGQMYLPFGRYSSSMISSPLTQYVGQTKARAIVVGFHPYEGAGKPYAEGFVFRSAANSNPNRINGFGADGGYAFQLAQTTGDIGIGYINNLADAAGFQDNGLGSAYYQGFNQSSTTENLVHNVAGTDIHAVFGWGPLIFITEYVTAIQRYSPADLTYNGHGAKPSALDAEATYSFNLWTKPCTFTLDYGASRQALALNIPRTRYGTAFQVAIVADTLFTIEYLHNINYGKNDTATGDSTTAYTAADLGKSSNTMNAQIGVYF